MTSLGRALLVWRFLVRDIRRRKIQSLLLVAMVVTTTSTLTVALALHHTSQAPFAKTRAATKGPDLVVENGPAPGSGRPSPTQFDPLIRSRGVSATSGPFPIAFTRLSASGTTIPVDVEGRDPRPAAVDQPLVTAGGWVERQGAVIEQGLANSLGLHVHDKVELGGDTFRVVGIAVTTGRPFYPAAAPGLVWLTRPRAAALATPSEPLGYVLDLKLRSGASLDTVDGAIQTFGAAAAHANVPSLIDTWDGIRAHDYKVISLDQKILLIGGWLLAMLAVASIAVVVGGRMAEQTRRVGLLKAVGAGPTLVAVVMLAENLVLALAGAVVGLAVGTPLAAELARPGDGLLGEASAPPLTVSSAAIVVGVAAAVAAAATLSPALQGARRSTMRSLSDPASPPRRHPWIISLSAALPVSLLLGLRLVARRTRRTVLTAASLTIAVTMVVAALTVQRDLEVTKQGRAVVGFFTTSATVQSANHVLIMLSVVLVALAAISATFTAWATAIDAQYATALARALGATPRQISAGLASAQLLPALVAACVGIPAGLALYQLAGGHLREATPPVSWLIAVIPGTLVAVAAVTALPARLGAGRPVAEVLRSD